MIANSQAKSAFLAGKPILIGRYASNLAQGREVLLIAKNKANKKTGHMVQLAILDPSINPEKIDKTVENGQGCDNRCSAFEGCYVQAFKFHVSSFTRILDDYNSGILPKMSHDEFCKLLQVLGLQVRFGEFGDPAAIPENIIDDIASSCNGWTGYTHYWQVEEFQSLKRYFMASVESKLDYDIAKYLGWNCFYVNGQSDKALRIVPCLFDVLGKQCDKCMLCNGTSGKQVDIVIEAHGQRRGRIS